MLFHHKVLFSLACCLASAAVLFAQKPLPTESVDVVKDFEVRLLESNKINVSPTLPRLDTTTKRQDYLVPSRPLGITYEAPKLKPIGMKSAGKEQVYNGYAKLGAGIPSSFLGEAGYYFSSGEKFDGRFAFRHHSAKFKELENQQFFKNNGQLNVNAYLDKNIGVSGNIGYTYDRVHYYGYDHDSLDFAPDVVRQDFKIFDIGARVYNSKRTPADLNYFVEPKLYLLNDYYSNREVGFNLGFGATKWFAEKHPLTVIIRTDATKYKDTLVQTLNNIYLQPSFTLHTDFLQFKIGGNFASNRDVFHVFPDVELAVNVIGEGVQLFGGLGGDLRKNTYRITSEYNPFIQMRVSELRNTIYRNYYGGIKGNLGWLNYSGQAGYATAEDLALHQAFITPEGITRFALLYDTAKIFNLQGTIKLKVQDLTISGTISQNVYDLEHQTNAWGLPELEANATAIYSLLGGKANLRAELYVADRIAFRPPTDVVTRTSEPLFDVSFGGSYYFTDNIGLFLDINNLLNTKRERWLHYPTYGLNVLGGITARF